MKRSDWRDLAWKHGQYNGTEWLWCDSPAWLAGYRDGYRQKRCNWIVWEHNATAQAIYGGQGEVRYKAGYGAGTQDGRLDRGEE